MSVSYSAVLWNRQKRIYDAWLAAGVLLYLACFLGVTAATQPDITPETMMIRAFGTAALVLLHVILAIGPLARLDRRFLPLLYNRRHMGVTMFLLAAAHGVFSIVQFHTLGDVHPVVSVFLSNTRLDSVSQFPFQPLGFVALIILFLMAATSHDFWLANLTAPVWKALHMGVYVAYALIVLHVALGALQSERHFVPSLILGLGMVGILGLHLVAGWRERGSAGLPAGTAEDGFVRVCTVSEIPEDCARVVTLADERVAVFRYGDKISAVSNVCQHQNGPLGEGRILDGCITCPWHGYQYLPESGQSPPPFTERIPTFAVRVEGDDVWVNPKPNAPGTPVPPATFSSGGGA